MPPNFGAPAGQSSPVETTARPVGMPLYLPCAYTCSTFAQQCLLGSSLRNLDLLPAHALRYLGADTSLGIKMRGGERT